MPTCDLSRHFANLHAMLHMHVAYCLCHVGLHVYVHEGLHVNVHVRYDSCTN
jgi:hypothetical protein